MERNLKANIAAEAKAARNNNTEKKRVLVVCSSSNDTNSKYYNNNLHNKDYISSKSMINELMGTNIDFIHINNELEMKTYPDDIIKNNLYKDMKFDMILFAGCNVVEFLFPTIYNVDITEKFLKDDGLIIFMNSITYNNNNQLTVIPYITPMAPRNLTCTIKMMKFYPWNIPNQILANNVYNQWDNLFYIDPANSKYYIYKKRNTTSTKYTYGNPIYPETHKIDLDNDIANLYKKVSTRLAHKPDKLDTLNNFLQGQNKKEQLLLLRNYMGWIEEQGLDSQYVEGRPRNKPNMSNTCFMASALSLLEAAYIHNKDNLFKPAAYFIIRNVDYPTNMEKLMEIGDSFGLVKGQQHDANEALLFFIYNDEHPKFNGSYLGINPITSIELPIENNKVDMINFLNNGDNSETYNYECSIEGLKHLDCARHYLDILKKEHKTEFDNIITNRTTSLHNDYYLISERPSDFIELFDDILIKKYSSVGFRKNTKKLNKSYNLDSNYLLFSIKRNTFLSKNVDSIKMPIQFDVNKVHNNATSKYKYKLLSYIEHQGLSPNGGHYVAYVRKPNERGWWECNDGIISDIKGPDNINYSMTYLYAREPQYNIVTAGSEENYYNSNKPSYSNEIKLGILGGCMLSEYWKQITLVLCILVLLYIIYLYQINENKKCTEYINYTDYQSDNSEYNSNYRPII